MSATGLMPDDGYEAGDEPKLNRIADMVDDLAEEMRSQLAVFGPSCGNLIKKIEEIQTAIYRP